MKKELFEIYDSGATELNAVVTKVAKENSLTLITMDKTPFRPASGGQPTDKGMIENEFFSAEVLDTIEKDGNVVHKCEVKKGEISDGDKVVAKIDGKRRKKLMLMHSGEHLFFSCLKSMLAKKGITAEIEKVSIGEEESTLFVKASSLNWYIIFEAEALANSIIMEARPVSIRYAEKEDIPFLEKKGLRIKEERIKEGFIRVIEFSGTDLSACTGTHVKNTSEIECFIATEFKNLGAEKFEMKFKTGNDALKELFSESMLLRKEQAVLGTRGEETFQLILKIVEEKRVLEEKQQRALYKRIEELSSERINAINFYSSSFDNEEQKVIVKAASKLCAENAVVAFINRKNETAATIYLMRSKELELDLLAFFKEEILTRFPGKGGGNENYVTGTIEASDDNEVLLAVKQFLLVNAR